MENSTKRILTLVFFLTIISFAIKGLTNVSGGIYSNTTWTLANSPYIVVDTVVVFPGVTLTIQPGVIVKFDNNIQLEIRQAKLIAIGTSADSITFTSNSSLPTPGMWLNIFFNGGALRSKFNYCNFRYADQAIVAGQYDTLTVRNCNFFLNNTGFSGYPAYTLIDSCNFSYNVNYAMRYATANINYCNISHNKIGAADASHSIFNNCVFEFNWVGIGPGDSITGAFGLTESIINNCFIKHNHSGIEVSMGSGIYGNSIKNCVIDSNTVLGIEMGASPDSIINCEIKYNGIGVIDDGGSSPIRIITKNSIENNSIGIELRGTGSGIFCNKICNNTTYDVKSTVTFGSNGNVSNNYWCTTDSSIVSTKIYDGYDNINLGLISFMPIDTLLCYLTTDVSESVFQNFSFNIYPNPASDHLTVTLPTGISNAEIKIFNMLGELEYSITETKQNVNIDISTLASGLHIIQIATGGNISIQKFIKQ